MSRPSSRRRRDAPPIATSWVDVHPTVTSADRDRLIFGDQWRSQALPAWSDRRLYEPEARPRWSAGVNVSPVRRRPGVPSRYVAPKLGPSYRIGFERPQSLPVCVRRAIRRQVLHAFGFGGVRKLRPPKRSHLSSVSC